MWIIGVDYHPSVQQIAFVNTDTGECGERRHYASEMTTDFSPRGDAGRREKFNKTSKGH
jgi:hypothetical protein